MSYERYGEDSYYSGGNPSPWSQPGGRQGSAQNNGSNRSASMAWSQTTYSDYGANKGTGSGGAYDIGSGSNPEMQMLVSQVKQLQQKVLELTSRRPNDDLYERRHDDDPMSGGRRNERKPQVANGQRRILLVNNLPSSLQTCDAVFYMFEKFGTVERVKILQKQRSSALVQMTTVEAAERAVAEQEILKKTARDIFVDFSMNVTIIKMPSDQFGQEYDSLTRDYTGNEPPPDYPSGNKGPMVGSQGQSLLGAPPGLTAFEGALLQSALGMNRRDNLDTSSANGPCILVSGLPEEMAFPDSLCNLFGFYGDVIRVKILRNKRDCALIQMSKPHQATQCRNFLDQAKVYGKKMCVSFSRMVSIKLPSDIGIEDDGSTKDFTNVRGIHRFRNPQLAQKLMKNLCSPTSVLHVANLPEQFGIELLREYITDNGFTVKDVQECGKDGSMALVQLSSVEESIACLSKLHNKTLPEMKSKNNAGLCFSFSNRRLND